MITRWSELVRVLEESGVTERQAAVAVAESLRKAGGTKEHRTQCYEAADKLDSKAVEWRREDRAAE